MAKEAVKYGGGRQAGKTAKPPVVLKYKVPATLGGAIDLLFKVREARKKLDSKAEGEKQQENLIENLIFERFGKSDLEGARGKAAQASVSRKEVPVFDNDEKFFEHLRKHPEDIDLLERRLSRTAVRERWAAGKTVPGVGSFVKVSLSLTKRKK